MVYQIGIYIASAFFEIVGCFCFWLVFKLGKPFGWLILGFVSLFAFAFLLSKVELEFAGRAYAIYGGIYIISSLFWLYFVEGQSFNRYDILGAFVIFCGILIMLFGGYLKQI